MRPSTWPYFVLSQTYQLSKQAAATIAVAVWIICSLTELRQLEGKGHHTPLEHRRAAGGVVILLS